MSSGALPGTNGLEPWSHAVDRRSTIDDTAHARERDDRVAVGLVLTDRTGRLRSVHPREDAHDRKSTAVWSWRQRLVGDPTIEVQVALHNLPHGHRTFPQRRRAGFDGRLAASAAAPVRSTLQGAAFAQHDMALSSQCAMPRGRSRVRSIVDIARRRPQRELRLCETVRLLSAAHTTQSLN